MDDYTGNNWRIGSSNESFEGKFVNLNGKTFNRFRTEGSCTGNITHNAESTEV